MDTRPQDAYILKTALEALRTQGVEARILAKETVHGPVRADAVVRLGRGKNAITLAAEVNQHVTKATLGAVVEQLRRYAKAPLLVTDYVTPPVAIRLREEGVAFIDAAGNANIDAPGLLVRVMGNRPHRQPGYELAQRLKKHAAARAFEPAGIKILFAFLCNPELVNRPFREIAHQANVAHGTVGWVMGELPHRGYVYDFGKDAGGRKLKQVDQLLVEWAAAYARKLKPKLTLGRYRARDPNWWKNLEPTAYGAVLGAEPAAAKITRHLKPAIVTVYADKVEPRLIVDYALRADPTGDVELAKRFWKFETEETGKGLAPLPLIYADLLATGDPRCIETAGLIRERYLARSER